MPRGNSNNGHKKKGGRKPGTPNKLTRELREAILAAAEHVGLDGKGFGGLTGYFTRLALKTPTSFGSLLGRLLPMQEVTRPVQHTLDLSKLDDNELMAMERITAKAQVPLPPDDDASLQPFDDDEYHAKISELLKQPVKEKKNS